MHIIQLYLLTESSSEALSRIPSLEQNTGSIPELHAAALGHEVTSPPVGPPLKSAGKAHPKEPAGS